ncbi:DUF6196 family protein [Arcobacter sp.]|uniref:DUF6196 family protein n=1 Tax=Arcobacter sp. TaxID=1872629 RepID=UPI003D0B2B06
MVHISHETLEQIEKRLLKVIAQSEIKIYEGTYVFDEFPLSNFPANVDQNALALVRDSEVWSQLVPSIDKSKELFVIFSFHFDGCSDNSGFVGWLANHLKRNLGTGVFVTCGQNTNRGGIFDYWGCPAELYEDVTKELEELISKGKLIQE